MITCVAPNMWERSRNSMNPDGGRDAEKIVEALEMELFEDCKTNVCIPDEPYIDDQVQIEEIWNIVESLLKRGGFEKEPWEVKVKTLYAMDDADSGWNI